MLLNGTEQTLVLGVWLQYGGAHGFVFEEVFLVSLVRHVDPNVQNCLDLFYQRKENRSTALLSF